MNYPNPHGAICPWYEITELVGAPNIKWCEETLCRWISEPANTWSNLGYLIIALVIMYLGHKNRHNANMKLFGPIIFFMGAMSFFYHLSNFYGSQILDFVGMFFFVGWAIGMNLIRLGKIRAKNLVWFNLGLGAFYTVILHAMYVSDIRYQGIVLVSGIIILCTEIMARKITVVSYRWFTATIFILIAAFGFSISDGKRLWCDSTQHGWFSQGHALWHWIASLGMLTIYLHYSQPALRPTEKT